jgi:hypothetical protein
MADTSGILEASAGRLHLGAKLLDHAGASSRYPQVNTPRAGSGLGEYSRQAGRFRKQSERFAEVHSVGAYGSGKAESIVVVRCGGPGEPGMVFAMPVLYRRAHGRRDADADGNCQQARPARQEPGEFGSSADFKRIASDVSVTGQAAYNRAGLLCAVPEFSDSADEDGSCGLRRNSGATSCRADRELRPPDVEDLFPRE